MSTVVNNRTYYRTSEACQTAGVSRSTFFRWLKIGVLEDVPHKDRKGWRLFTQDDIDEIKAEANKIREVSGNARARATEKAMTRRQDA